MNESKNEPGDEDRYPRSVPALDGTLHVTAKRSFLNYAGDHGTHDHAKIIVSGGIACSASLNAWDGSAISRLRTPRKNTKVTVASIDAPIAPAHTSDESEFARKSARRASHVEWGGPSPEKYFDQSQSQAAPGITDQGMPGRNFMLAAKNAAHGMVPAAATRKPVTPHESPRAVSSKDYHGGHTSDKNINHGHSLAICQLCLSGRGDLTNQKVLITRPTARYPVAKPSAVRVQSQSRRESSVYLRELREELDE